MFIITSDPPAAVINKATKVLSVFLLVIIYMMCHYIIIYIAFQDYCLYSYKHLKPYREQDTEEMAIYSHLWDLE